MKMFTAAFPGTCASCGWDFDEGDEIGYLDNELVAECCFEEDDIDGVGFTF